MTTIAKSTAIAIAIGITRFLEATLAASKTTSISSVAYATEERASEAKTGSARTFGSSGCPNRRLEGRRPTSRRFRIPRGLWVAGGAAVVDIRPILVLVSLRFGNPPVSHARFGHNEVRRGSIVAELQPKLPDVHPQVVAL